MRCDSCGFISFRFNKKCPSCNATIRQSKGSLADEPAFSIFATSEMLAGGSAIEQDGVGALEDDLRGEGFSDDVNVDLPEAENVDFDLDLSDIKSFNLDLSDAQAGSGTVATKLETAEAVPEISVASATDEEVDMQFDVEPGAEDLDEIPMDDLDFDFDAEPESAKAAIDGSSEVELSLDEPAEIAANFDLESGDDAGPTLDLLNQNQTLWIWNWTRQWMKPPSHLWTWTSQWMNPPSHLWTWTSQWMNPPSHLWTWIWTPRLKNNLPLI